MLSLAHNDTNVPIPSDTVGNDNGVCGTLWETCSISEGAFLPQVGHASGADHMFGIMARRYAQDVTENFLSHTAYCAKTCRKGKFATPWKEAIDGRS